MSHSKELFNQQAACLAVATAREEEAKNRAFLARCHARARAIGLIEEVLSELPAKLYDLEEKLHDAVALLEGRPVASRIADDQSEAAAAWRALRADGIRHATHL